MLLSFGARNFYCFKEGFEISFELTEKCPTKISNGKNHTNILCVKGANASGKTNILKAISFIGNFCTRSFFYEKEAPINYETYFNNEGCSEFYVEFVVDKVNYRYELTLHDGAVESETLYRKKSRLTKIIERKERTIVHTTKEFKELNSMKLRKNASFISTAEQYDFNSIKKIHYFFGKILSNVGAYGRHELQPGVENVTEYYNKYPDVFEFVKEYILRCDLGISNIVIKELEGNDGEKKYLPFFVHNTNSENSILSYYSQSSGTQSLYLQLGHYQLTLEYGGLLILDEFDINFHPHMLKILLELFENEKINKSNSQLLFSTHNTQILDYLGKYRTYLVNIDNGESYCYRLDEIPGEHLRNDRLISPIYNSGKIGGVPRL